MHVPKELLGKTVVLFGVLPELRPNEPGKPPTAAIAIVEYADGWMEALELDADGEFISPYDTGVESIAKYTASDHFAEVDWVDPRSI
jgi:hypothetical protein